MITNGSPSRPPAIGAIFQFLIRAKWYFSLAIAVLLTVAATPPPATLSDETTDEQYIHIMDLMDRGNALRDSGKPDAARSKYKDARTDLLIFQKAHPHWNTATVEYRLKEVTEDIEGKPPVESAPVKTTKPRTNLEAPAKSSSASSSKSTVKLLDPGAEPRKVLRLHVKAGDQQTVIMTLKMNMDMGGAAAGKANAIPSIPAISIPMDVTIQNVAPNGDLTYEMVFEEPGLADEPGTSPLVTQAMKAALSGFKGLTMTGLMSDHGITRKVDVKLPAGVNPQVRQTLDQMKENMLNTGSPLPGEPVGAGAKWEVKMPVKSSGMTLNQTTDYQLVSDDGDHLSTTFTQTQSAANQKMQNPAMGAAQMNVIQLTSTSSGNVTSDLSKLMPLQATIDSHMEMNSEITAGGKTQPMDMKMGINISIQSR